MWHQVSFCTCSSFSDNQQGNPDAICCFPFGSTRFLALVPWSSFFNISSLFQAVGIYGESRCQASWVRMLICLLEKIVSLEDNSCDLVDSVCLLLMCHGWMVNGIFMFDTSNVCLLEGVCICDQIMLLSLCILQKTLYLQKRIWSKLCHFCWVPAYGLWVLKSLSSYYSIIQIYTQRMVFINWF